MFACLGFTFVASRDRRPPADGYQTHGIICHRKYWQVRYPNPLHLLCSNDAVLQKLYIFSQPNRSVLPDSWRLHESAKWRSESLFLCLVAAFHRHNDASIHRRKVLLRTWPRENFLSPLSTESMQTPQIAFYLVCRSLLFSVLLCSAYSTYDVDVLQKRPTMPAFKNYAISYLRSNTRSFNYTLDVLRTLERLTFVEMERLGENPLLVGIMDHIRVPDM